MSFFRSVSAALVVATAGLWLIELLKPLSVSTQVEMHLVLAAGALGVAGLALPTPAGTSKHRHWAALIGGWVGVGLGAWTYVHLSGEVPYAWALAIVAAAGAWAATWSSADQF